MKRVSLAIAAAAVLLTAGSSFGVPAKAANLQMAQVDVRIPDRNRDRDRDRDLRDDRYHRDRREGVTVGVGPGGVVVRPAERCHWDTTTTERDDGRRVTRRERVCN